MKNRRILISLLLAVSLMIQSALAIPVFAADEEMSLAAPSSVKAVSLYNNKADIKWKSVKGADGYEIWRNKKLIQKVEDATEFHNTRLKTDKKYSYKIRAYAVSDGKTIYSPYTKAVKIKAKKRNPKVLIVDNSSLSIPVTRKLKKAGCSVKKVYSLDRVDPDQYDALVIPGGGDINAKYYGQNNNPNNYGINNYKDKLQIKSVKRFAKAGKPVLGICRGAQVINVALGGTLEQHIGGFHLNYRTVSIKKGSWLYDVYGSRKSVYHYHHQCVDKLGKDLKATQWDTGDGRIEGFQHKKLPIYGLQWHPEMGTSKGAKVFSSFRKVIMKQLAE